MIGWNLIYAKDRLNKKKSANEIPDEEEQQQESS